MNKSLQSGFTIVELMIVVAIIGILAAVAYPAYEESTAKARRADAQGALMGLSSAMERFYTQTNSYGGAANGGADDGAPDAAIFPSQAPLDGSTKFYNLTIDAADDGNSYVLSAVPIAGGAMAGDKCGTMTLSSTGAKTPTGVACWK